MAYQIRHYEKYSMPVSTSRFRGIKRSGNLMGSILGPTPVIAIDVKSCAYCCYDRSWILIVWVEGMSWPQWGATQYNEQLGLPDKGRTIKGLVVCNDWDLEPLDLIKRSSPRLLSTVPWGINRIKYFSLNVKLWILLRYYYLTCRKSYERIGRKRLSPLARCCQSTDSPCRMWRVIRLHIQLHRQPTLWLYDIYLEVITVHGHSCDGQVILPALTMYGTHLT